MRGVGKYLKMKILVLTFLEKIKFDAFSWPSTLNTENLIKKLRLGYVYIKESFDTIFNMDYGSGKSPMDKRVKII